MQRCGTTSISSSHILVICFALLIAISISIPASSQVTIHERVKIDLFTQLGIHPKLGVLPPPTEDLFIIAPKAGTVRIVFSMAGRVTSPIPVDAFSRFSVGATNYFGNIADYLPISTSQLQFAYDTCQHPPFYTQYWQYNRYSDQSPPLAVYTQVEEGDTLRFLYHGANDIASGSFQYQPWAPMWLVTNYSAEWNPCLDTPNPLEFCSYELSFADTVVTFQRPDSTRLYPKYLNRNGTGPKRNYIDLEVQTKVGEQVVGNVMVQLDSPILINDGGHSHANNRPMGRFRVEQLQDPSKFDTLQSFSRATDSTGTLKFRFLANEFGGIERLTARIASDSLQLDTLSLLIRWGELYDFAAVDTWGWFLTGNSGTTNYGRCSGAQILHYSNHWFHEKYVDSLALGMIAFYSWSSSETGLGMNLEVGVNDMSLQFGGLFDICSNWGTGHKLHRTGGSVDINRSARIVGSQEYHYLNNDDIDMLENFIFRRGGTREPESEIHFEFGSKGL